MLLLGDAASTPRRCLVGRAGAARPTRAQAQGALDRVKHRERARSDDFRKREQAAWVINIRFVLGGVNQMMAFNAAGFCWSPGHIIALALALAFARSGG